MRDAFARDVDRRADRVAIRFRSDEMQTQRAISGRLIVAVKIRGAVIRRQQKISVAVVVEISVGEAAADFWCVESSADFARNVVKFSVAAVEKKLRRLRVADVVKSRAKHANEHWSRASAKTWIVRHDLAGDGYRHWLGDFRVAT